MRNVQVTVIGMKSKFKTTLVKLGLMLSGLLLGFLLIEILLAVLISEQDKLILQRKIDYLEEILECGDIPSYRKVRIGRLDRKYGWSLIPHAQDVVVTSEFNVLYKINSQGLREEEIALKHKRKFRIIALGESNTFGEGVNFGKRFTEVIEDKLPVEMINIGIWGYGLDQCLLLFKNEGLKYHPDMVFIFVNRPLLERVDYKFAAIWTKPFFTLDNSGKKLIFHDVGKEIEALQSEITHVDDTKTINREINGRSWECYFKKFLLKYSIVYQYFYFILLKKRVTSDFFEIILEKKINITGRR